MTSIHGTGGERQRRLRAVVNDDRPPNCVPRVDQVALGDLAEAVLVALEVSGVAELALTLVDVDTITGLNVEYMGATGPTDVLSFPIDANSEDDFGDDDRPRLLGDVVICPEVAAINAPEHAGTLDDELALLCVHGILHVLGHDHAEEAEATVMRDLEASLLAAFHRPLSVGTEIP